MNAISSDILSSFYFVILSTNLFAIGPTIKDVAIAIGKPTDQALKNLLGKSLSIPVFMNVIIKVINKLIPKPIIKIKIKLEYFFLNILIYFA
tara:strand:+ start:580 stop:855 length:276 start_codon:yes stop_codon:yes gene_type:complete